MNVIKIIYRSLKKIDLEYIHGTDGGIALAEFAYIMGIPNLDSEIAHDLFMRYANIIFEFPYDADTTITDLAMAIIAKHGISATSNDENYRRYPQICFYIDNQIVYCSQLNTTIHRITKKFNISGSLYVFFIFSGDAGEIWKDDGLRYYMPSHEQGSHSIPHVHVDYKHTASGTISIIDGKVLAGDLPSRVVKIVRKRVLEEQDYLKECWNKMTDGFIIDINYDWGKRALIGIDADK